MYLVIVHVPAVEREETEASGLAHRGLPLAGHDDLGAVRLVAHVCQHPNLIKQV